MDDLVVGQVDGIYFGISDFSILIMGEADAIHGLSFLQLAGYFRDAFDAVLTGFFVLVEFEEIGEVGDGSLLSAEGVVTEADLEVNNVFIHVYPFFLGFFGDWATKIVVAVLGSLSSSTNT